MGKETILDTFVRRRANVMKQLKMKEGTMNDNTIEKILDTFVRKKADYMEEFSMISSINADNINNHVLTIQECNMGGEYLRCFYVRNSNIYYFVVSDINFFKNMNYTSSEIEEYVLMWTK